ncbi:MAG TPA: response regulator [Verrucomicrobiae bacterium]|nr:response regulator [Verrucomicrobiae bacterium]
MNRLKAVIVLLLVVLPGILSCGPTTNAVNAYAGESEGGAVDPHFAEKIQSAGREQQEQFRPRVSIPDAVGDDVPLATTLRRPAEPLRVQSPRVWLNDSRTLLLAFMAAALALAFLSRRLLFDLLKALNATFNPLMAASDTAAELPTKVRAEEKGLAEFLAALKAGPEAGITASTADLNVIDSFYGKLAAKLGNLRQMARELRRTSDDCARQKILAALRWELHSIRAEAVVPELRPIWQVTFAMEGLLKQLTENVRNITPSTLRTLKGSLELLSDINRPGVESLLLYQKPLQLLAVDDDPIGRRAVYCALERALNKPEVAEDCDAALALAAAKTYDVIFLDVQMPKMDGFELCTRIHETFANRNTPIVFVTGHSDFETRAKSTLVGSADLIGKPFLTFEITVKALTVVLRSRLNSVDEKPAAVETPVIPVAEPLDNVQSSQAFLETAAAGSESIEAWQIANGFLAGTSERLLPLREAFQDLLKATDSGARRDLLGDVYVYVHSFIHQELPTTHPAVRLRTAIEGLLKKLLEKPVNATAATFSTLATAVQVLDELCLLARADQLVERPVRMLVVDDDSSSRAAISAALQTMFGKPDEAEGGDGALALVGSQTYDVIFIDTRMPIMDGFEVHDRIRQSTANQFTPIIFVTRKEDGNARSHACAIGASDLIEKPFLSADVILKALTFALRGRLKNIERNEGATVVSAAPSSQPQPWNAETSSTVRAASKAFAE